MLWLIVPLGVLIGVVGFGAIYQALATSRDRRKFPPSGKLIEINGKTWHYQIMGEGHLTVVVDSGTGGTHLDWQLVQPEVAKFTRILTYDRAGYGWSDMSSETRTAEQVVSELRQLLREVEIEPPYVLVGMSLGGLFSRLFAYCYPEEVAGMVLVDVAHERMYEETPVEWVELNQRLERLLTHVVPIIARIGLLRLLVAFDSLPMAAGLFQKFPPSMRPLAKALYSQTQFGKTFAQESAAVSVSMSQVEQARKIKPFPDIPLIVLSSGKPDFDITQDVLQKLQELHADLASESPQGIHIIARESGHAIQLDKPELVVDAIRQVFEKVRCGSAL
ncbi:alpha/beta hydrolase [Gloeocapsopsis crepidinum LEGE 06123]|uniref:Alpha/beta hydrolase n=1 Tax=Gloeocapsopsis crepidinum LEGE 06123 TaxID=588587 RepID=A0ABR9UTN7_9CHRO|nr:alpha/beta hydrolase [Gloeocapsopsis crepidinum]MBE9190718.1 alpha/beta hydrolase [Gloeocapsopsis crepidinum LEGE 06123]